MRTDEHGEEAREATPGLQVFAPGETVPTPHAPAAAREFERGNGPLDDPPLPPRRQVGRKIIEHGK
jgi:hypothetical protein